MQGVTDDNKGEVCQAFATDLQGTVKHCDFSRSTRRLLSGASKLYVDIEFPDEVTTTNAETKVAEDNYLDNVIMPSGVTVTSMKEAQPGKAFPSLLKMFEPAFYVQPSDFFGILFPNLESTDTQLSVEKNSCRSLINFQLVIK